jgi:predicted transcriptional regulator
MDLEGCIAAITEDLGRIASLGDETTAKAAELLASALESSVSRRIQDALSEAALEISAQLEHGSVELRLAANDPQLIYVANHDAPPTDGTDEALEARITLRLPDSLKTRLDAAAAGRGVSVNTWLLQTLTRALDARPTQTKSGRRLSGYGHS